MSYPIDAGLERPYINGYSVTCKPTRLVIDSRIPTILVEKIKSNKLKILLFSSSKDAIAANDVCYAKYNTRGDRYGYCKIHSANSYLRCSSK